MKTIINLRASVALLLLALFAGIEISSAQVEESDWSFSKTQKINDKAENLINAALPTDYSVWQISIANFKSKLQEINGPQEIKIPSPEGKFETYIIIPSKVVANEVAHLYTIKTFRGYKKGEPSTLIACDVSDAGFRASIFTANNSYFIEPLYKHSSETVIAFYKKNGATSVFNCMTTSIASKLNKQIKNIDTAKSPSTKRTYRLAILAANSYRLQFGGNPYNPVNVLNALAAGTNMINVIYLRDLGVEFSLVSDNALIQQDNDSENLTNKLNDAIGVNAYDVGHMVLWGAENGLAGLQVVCGNDKGNGFSSSSMGVATLWVDYVAHEVGHQFGSEHNQSGCNSVQNYRYEPGEGSSIMAYANVCQGNEQYAQNSDPFFHYASIAQIIAELPNFNCSVNDAGGNANNPVANAQADFTIPMQTPFIVVGSGNDNNDPANNLTYHWVQYDGSGLLVNNSPSCNVNNNALFRFRSATTDNYRSLPQYSDVLAGNNNQQWELLPCTTRDINFSLTVRDNNSTFGRLAEDRTVVTVANTGPFEVTSPNGGEIFSGNDTHTVTWTVNQTNTHCANVDILISTDGGNTYSVVSNATANDGAESITIPNTITTNARVLVRCDVNGGFRAASTFYDVSNFNFEIQETLSVGEFSLFNINVFPNPASNALYINLSDNKSFDYKLYSVNGRLIYNDEINKSTVLNTSSLANGLYFLQIRDVITNRQAVKKIIISH